MFNSVAEEARALKDYAHQMSVLWNNALIEVGENERHSSESGILLQARMEFLNGRKANKKHYLDIMNSRNYSKRNKNDKQLWNEKRKYVIA